jgi:hypothetical protein
MADEPADAPQRWTAKRRVVLVVSILKGETSAQAAARKHGRAPRMRRRSRTSTSRSSSRRLEGSCSTWTF